MFQLGDLTENNKFLAVSCSMQIQEYKVLYIRLMHFLVQLVCWLFFRFLADFFFGFGSHFNRYQFI